MKELQQAKVLATAVKLSKNEIEKRVATLQEQLDSIKVIRGPVGPTGPKGDSGDDAKPVIVEAVGPQGEKGDKVELTWVDNKGNQDSNNTTIK